MVERPSAALRRLAPDPVQTQVIVGSLLGDGRLIGRPGERRLLIAHERPGYVRWKYDRLGPLAASWPVRSEGRVSFTTIVHPLFDDLARLDRARLLAICGPLGLAVWLTDLGRLELSLDAFLPEQRAAICAA